MALAALQVLSVLAQGQQDLFYGYGYYSPPVNPNPEDLLINEFQSRPESGNPEWIELYNSTQKPLSLESCELRDAVGLITQFPAELFLAPDQHYLHELTRTKLNNSGDSITLLCDEHIIDQVAYGNHSSESYYRSSQGFDESLGYLPAPGVGKSLARLPDGSATWFIFGEPTPGTANEVQNEKPQAIITLQGTKKVSACDSLSVNVTGENSTDPDGDTLNYSWSYREKASQKILHSTDRVNPLSFKFERSMGEQFEIALNISDPFGGTHSTSIPISLGHCPNTKLTPGSEPQASSFQLSANIHISELLPNPSGKDSGNEYVELYNSGNIPVRLDGWKLGAKTKKSLEGKTIEPFNFLIFKNITLRNSGDTVQLLDPETQVQSEVRYEKADDDASWSRNSSGVFQWTVPTPGQQNDFPFQTETIYLQASSPLIITRFLPNPKGKDEGNEWIELMNRSEETLDLSGWQLDNREGGSKPYPLSASLRPQETLRLDSSQTKITLRNSSDQVRLLSSSAQVMDLLEWNTPAPDGRIFQRNQLIRDLSIEPDMVRVVKVVDGDTIDVEVDGEIERVRLIGVDTPETVHPFKALEHFGKEASQFTKSQLEGREVRLEYDLSKRGKYGRLLAYVWLGEKHFNAELVKKGYAFAYLRYPFQYREDFRRFELEAQQAGEGLWKSDEIQKIREEQELVIDEELEELQTIEEILEELEKPPEELEELEVEEERPEKTFLQWDQSGWDQLILNEILPNPKGKDSDGGEFIELKYSGTQPLRLEGWIIKNSKEKTIWKFNGDVRTSRDLSDLKEANKPLPPERSNPSIILIHPKFPIKNSSETLQLIDPLGQTRDQFSYDQSMKDDQVWARHPEVMTWHLLITPTPGEANPSDILAHQPKPKQKKSKKSSKKLKPLYQVIEQPKIPPAWSQLIPFAHASISSPSRKNSEPLYLGGFLALLLLLVLILKKRLFK